MTRFNELLLPPNSKRRLLCTLISRAVSQPRDFFRYVNLSSFRYFINYLRNADPELVGKMVDEVLARDKAQADQAGHINDHFLKAVTGTLRQIKHPLRTATVDIIIPVYNAPELTEACIRSVLAGSENCRLILVNDASSDERVRALLDSAGAVPERGIEVVVHHNAENLGFVGTVNYAFTLTHSHFIILNSDTEVPPGWIDRLCAPIIAEPEKVASVTPFSNAGMACSFPEPNRDNPIYRGMPHADLDAVFMDYGGTEPIELFSGVGFCMAFNRRVVEKIGLFDAETFGKGYGEEVDWCLRAYDSGFQHVLAPNLFVYHKHGGSFGAKEKARLMESNIDLLWKRHGRHMTRLREFVEADPLRSARETVIVFAGASSAERSRRVALLDVDFTGGGTIYSALLSAYLVSAGYHTMHFRFNHRQKYLKLTVPSVKELETIILPVDAAEKIAEVLAALQPGVSIVNQLTTWPEPAVIMNSLAGWTTPYLAMTHDFFSICPSWFLTDQNGRFCAVPESPETCTSCLKSNSSGSHHEFYGHSLDDNAGWRVTTGRFLSHAQKVICFSGSSIDYLTKVCRGLENIALIEHAIPNRDRFSWRERRYEVTGRLNLAIIGHLFPDKGALIVQEMLESHRFKALPVTLTVFGESPLYPPGHTSSDGRVTFTGGYRQEELQDLLERHAIHAVLIASIWPETFSFTTSEAILMGYPVICFDLGAQAERVNNYGCGIVGDAVSADALMDAIGKLIEKPELVSELSLNAQRYQPPTPDEHFGRIVEMIQVGTGECGSSSLSGEDT